MNNRFSSLKKIKSRREISNVFKTGSYFSCRYFSLKYVFNSELNYNRFAVLVSKRHGNAVQRNKIKRIYREVFRLSQKKFNNSVSVLLLPKVGLNPVLSEVMEIFVNWRKKIEK